MSDLVWTRKEEEYSTTNLLDLTFIRLFNIAHASLTILGSYYSLYYEFLGNL